MARPKTDPGRLGWNPAALRQHRELKAWTRATLCAHLAIKEDVHVTGSTIERWETPKSSMPSAEQASALAKVLGCTRRALGTTTT